MVKWGDDTDFVGERERKKEEILGIFTWYIVHVPHKHHNMYVQMKMTFSLAICITTIHNIYNSIKKIVYMKKKIYTILHNSYSWYTITQDIWNSKANTYYIHIILLSKLYVGILTRTSIIIK